MDANRGEAERCLREAEKWQRQNRPVKALKFAKKSHQLFPTQTAQQKIGELNDLLQARGYQDPDIQSSLNNNNNSNSNSNPMNNDGLRQRRNANHNSNPSQPRQPPLNQNRNQNQNQNQEFVEIDPNAINNSPSFLQNITDIEFWLIFSLFSIINTSRDDHRCVIFVNYEFEHDYSIQVDIDGTNIWIMLCINSSDIGTNSTNNIT